jgi:anti-sigma B factor antagonist
VKCFEITKCSELDRKSCIVWRTYKDLPQDMENIKCWVIKGVYLEENKAQLQKCRKCAYYIKMHQNSGISSNLGADMAIITCEGSINNDKSRALDQVWTSLKKSGKFKILMDISNVTNIYSCGLGQLVKIHKETEANKGALVLVGAHGTVSTIFSSTKLNHLLTIVEDQSSAIAIFDEIKKKELAAIEAAIPKPVPKPVRQIKTRIPCWQYWKGANPKNATKCDECYKKITNDKDPCWIVAGMVEGISFQYVNEECVGCTYFEEFCDSASTIDTQPVVGSEQPLQ